MTLIAFHTKSGDHYPVRFRPNCARTYFDTMTGQDEGLDELMVRLRRHGWELLSVDEFKRRTKK